MSGVVYTLAQRSAELVFQRMAPWLVVLFVAAMAGGAVLFYLRHRLLSSGDPAAGSRGLLEELRAMRDRGELDNEEFEQARLSMIAKATGKDLRELRNEAIRRAGGRVAEPGFDLTGRPLPGPGASPGQGPSPGHGTGPG